MTYSRAIVRFVLVAAMALAISGSGCFRPPPILDPSFPPECRVGPGEWRVGDTLRVSHPVTGVLDEERLVGSWILATPVYVDCNDDLRAGFASEWSRHDGGRRWSLTIRSGLRFSWDDELTAAEVATRWGSRIAVLDAGVDSVTASGDRVDVFFRDRAPDVPRALAGNAFGLRLRRWPAISLHATAGRDLRDVLEDIDLMVTLDSDVADYARRHERFTVTELPYDRVYVLLCRSRSNALAQGHDVPGLSHPLRESLAADAVRSSAQASGSDFWWKDVDDCTPPSQTVPWRAPPGAGSSASTTMQIAYEEGDPVARGIAERIVALASARNTDGHRELEAALPGLETDVQAIGVRRLSFDGAFACVVALPRAVADPCLERLRLIERVHWLLPVEDDLDRAIVPLVEARPYAIFRDGTPALSVDRFGNTRVVR